MTAVFLIIHLMLAIGLVTVVLLQRSDGGALGGLGGGGNPSSGGFGGLMSGRQSANLLTRITAILAACFMGTSLLLAILAAHRAQPTSILEIPATSEQVLPTPSESGPGSPSPTVPVSE